MAKEKAGSIVDEIRKGLSEGNGGGSMPAELLWIPKDGIKVVRFLSDMHEAVKVIMHNKYGKLMPQPCLKYYKKECPYHGGSWKTSKQYYYTVWDYEFEQKSIVGIKLTINSSMEDLLQIYDENGTLTDRDIKLTKKGERMKTRYRARQVQNEPEESKVKKKLSMPFSKEEVFKILEELIRDPKEEGEDEDDDDDDEPRAKKRIKAKAAKAKEDEEDEDEDEDDDDDDDDED